MKKNTRHSRPTVGSLLDEIHFELLCTLLAANYISSQITYLNSVVMPDEEASSGSESEASE